MWDDDFINETALDRALPAGVTPAQPKEAYLGTANYAPQPSETGRLLTGGLTADEQIGFTPLDEAVVRAVEKGKSTEVKRRLYGSILLVGGGARTAGLARYLEWRVMTLWKIAVDSTEGIERVEVKELPRAPSRRASAGAARRRCRRWRRARRYGSSATSGHAAARSPRGRPARSRGDRRAR